MRSSKQVEDFPYTAKYVCFMELKPNGELIQLGTPKERVEAAIRAMNGECKVVAVWLGQWRSDLFIIDDLEKFKSENYRLYYH